MSELRFEVVDIAPESYAVTPLLSARVAVSETTGEWVHAMVLRAQVRIEPQRRAYSDEEADGLVDLFGPRWRWSNTLRPYLWLQSSTVVPGFTGRTEVELSLPCTYDFDVAAAKYLSALDDGLVSVNFQFSGTVFVRGASGFSVHQVPWDAEASYQLPVSVWRAVMDAHFPGSGWVRLNHESFRALQQYRVDHGLLSADEAVDALLDRAVEAITP